MIDNKNSEIILCSGVKLDKNYENVLSYNEEQMVNLCRNNSIYTSREYTFIGNTNYIDIECPYGIAMYSNYVAFLNPTFGNKWMFAWVTDVKLINPKTSRIFFEIDVFSTWYDRFNINEAFIEREHVEDDTIGLHTVPENLETGEYIVNYENRNKQFDTLNIIVASNIDTYINPETGKLEGEPQGGGVYNRMPTGFQYYYFTLSSQGKFKDVIKAFDKAGKAENILSIFIAPSNSFERDDDTILDNGIVKQTFSPKYMDWENVFTEDEAPTKLSSLDGYVPVNNKLLTFPYCFLRMSNNSGADTIFHFEKFANNNENKCYFTMMCSICPGMNIVLYPNSYDNIVNNYNECLPAGKFPIGGWASDTYINWLTQNGTNIAISYLTDSLSLATGGGAVLAGNPQGIGSLTSGIAGIAGTLATIKQHRFNPEQSKGNVNVGDVKTSKGINTFTAYGMSIKKEFAIIIDRYFSRFGYKVNIVKTPNLKSRTKFNFIKVGGMDNLISGNIPASDLEKINDLFRKGITIFHNYSDVGNYTISNPIR